MDLCNEAYDIEVKENGVEIHRDQESQRTYKMQASSLGL